MKQIFFTPGPSQLYPTVGKHLQKAVEQQICSLSHRSEQFEEVFSSTIKGLRTLLNIPENYAVVFVSSGTEAMERIIQNTVKKKSFHFVNGSFSKRWCGFAKELGKDAEKEEVDFGRGFTTNVKISDETELICFTQNETSSGVAINPAFIYDAQQKHSDVLIAVDIVSSAPIVSLDFSRLDCTFFSVQKNFGLPSGLGALILSPRAIEKAKYLQKEGLRIGTYHNFPTLVEWAQKKQTPETPNVLAIYLLNEVIKDFLKKGIENIRKETKEKSDMVYQFLQQHKTYKPFVEEAFRSQTVIVTDVGDSLFLQMKLQQRGLIVGDGYGPYKDRQIRIANFPAVSMGDMKRLLEALDTISKTHVRT